MKTFILSVLLLLHTPHAGFRLTASVTEMTLEIPRDVTFSAGGGISSASPYVQQSTPGQIASRGGLYAQASGFQTHQLKPAGMPPIDPNAPVISAIADQVIDEDGRTEILPFTISDANTALTRLVLTRETSNPDLAPLTGIIFGGTGANRTVRVTPLPDRFGLAIITLKATDGTLTTSESFEVIVNPVNDPPTLSRIVNAATNEDVPTGEIQFTVGDLETAAVDLKVSASAADPGLVPPGNITFGGTGANRWLKIMPAPDKFGGTTIAYRVSDGDATTERTFPFSVISNNDAPTVTPLADVSLPTGGSATVEFTVADVDHSVTELNIAVQSDNTSLINNTGLKRTDLGGGRHSLLLTPNAERTGVAVITVAAVDPRGTPGRSTFKLAVGAAVAPIDFGDAPNTYSTTLAQNGARHTIIPGFHLGAGVDVESDGQPNSTATGDDTIGTDDEDGVVLPAALLIGSLNNITVIASAAGRLDAWIDFNHNGNWSDPGERIFNAQSLVAGANALGFNVPVVPPTSETFTRFRLSSAGGLAPAGTAVDGEVEDYRVVLAKPASNTLFAGLKWAALGSAQGKLNAAGALELLNLAAQPGSGLAFDLGQARGFMALQEATQMESRFIGLQGGQRRPLVSLAVKWAVSELNAARNEVSIETLELAHEGLTATHYDDSGRQLGLALKFAGGAALMQCIDDGASPGSRTSRRSGSIIILDNDGETEVARHSLRMMVLPFGIKSPRDSASGQATGRMIMKNGGGDYITLENYAFSVLSWEGLPQPVEALERVEMLGAGATPSFAVLEAGLFHHGLLLNGGGNTRLTGFLAGSQSGFSCLPEIGDEVVLEWQDGGISAEDDWETPVAFSRTGSQHTEFRLPETGGTLLGSELSLETSQTWQRPENPGVIESIGTKYILLKTEGGYTLESIFKGAVVGVEPSSSLRIFNQGAEVAMLNNKNPELTRYEIVGPGKPLRVRPGLPRRGESLIQSGITFDAPMTIKIGDQTFVGDEFGFAFKVDGIVGPETLGLLRLRSPDKTEYRLTPEEPWDWGDAPFMTTLAQNGARHRIVPGLRLGQRIDPEGNGRLKDDASGDDGFLDDDEDGVTFTSAIVPGIKGAQVNINVIAPPAGAFIDAFGDWNANGTFEDVPEEKILDKQPVKNGINTFTILVPANARLGKTFARFRLSSQGGLDCEGAANDGEVEDYQITLTPPGVAPQPLNGFAGEPVGGVTLTSDGRQMTVTKPDPASEAGVTFALGEAPGVAFDILQSGTVLAPLVPGLHGNWNFHWGGYKILMSGKVGGQTKNLLTLSTTAASPLQSIGVNADVNFNFASALPPGVAKPWTVRLLGANGTTLATASTDSLHLKYEDMTTDGGGWTAAFTTDASTPELVNSLLVPKPRMAVTGVVSLASVGIPAGSVSLAVTLPDGRTVKGVQGILASYTAAQSLVADSGMPAFETAQILMSEGRRDSVVSNFGVLDGGYLFSGDFRRCAWPLCGGVFASSRSGDGFKHSLRTEPGFPKELQVGFMDYTDDSFINAVHAAGSWDPALVVNEPGPSLDLGALDLSKPGSSVQSSVHADGQLNSAALRTLSVRKSATETGLNLKWQGAPPAAMGAAPAGLHAINAGGNEVAIETLEIMHEGQLVHSFQPKTRPFADGLLLEVKASAKPLARLQPSLPSDSDGTLAQTLVFAEPTTFTLPDGQPVVGDEITFKTSGIRIDRRLAKARLELNVPDQTQFDFTHAPRLDWGDLPPPYPTRLAQNGARHGIVNGLRLGRQIDPERDGLPSPAATGDDRRHRDDEDGAILTSSLVPGANATLNLAVRAPATGAFIDGFLDFNGDGDFGDAGEKVFDKKAVVNGVNALSFAVPSAARVGKTFLRIRLSSAGGLDEKGPAEDGEVEDYVVRIQAAAPPEHPSGLAVVPRGGADLKTTVGGGLEVAELSAGGDDGVTLLAPQNVVSRNAGRVILPVSPPIPLSSFTSTTQPFADGLVLEAHYTGSDGQVWLPMLSFQGGCVGGGCDVVRARADYCGNGAPGAVASGSSSAPVERVRISVFNAAGHVGSTFAACGDVGSFTGTANIIRLGWTTFPSSALVIFDGDVTFKCVDGSMLKGDRFRFFAASADDQPMLMAALKFSGISIYGSNVAGGLLGLSDLKVRNPAAPALKNLQLQPNGGVALEFTSQEDVLYTLEATDSLTAPAWKPPGTAFHFGTGSGSGQLSDPAINSLMRFYRVGVE